MKEVRMLIACFLMCLLTGAVTYYLVIKQQKKIGVADAVRLFDQFNMKIEMEQNAKVKLDLLNKRVDSVNSLLQLALGAKDEKNREKLSYFLSYAKEELDQEYRKSNKEINEKVWQRLNPAVNEFGKRKGFHVIIGANGMGSVLYNDDYYDITNQLITFVNEKYEGAE